MTAHDWDAIQREYRAGQLRHGHSQAHEGERVEPRTLGRSAEPGSRKFASRGVRANLLAGVTPSEAAIVDAAAAPGSCTKLCVEAGR